MSDGHERKKQPNQRKKGVLAKLRNLVKIPPLFKGRRRASAESAASAASVPSVESTSNSSMSVAPSQASSVKPHVASPEGNTQSGSLQLPPPPAKKPVKKSSKESIATAKAAPRATDQSTANKDAGKNNKSPPIDDEKADKLERELIKLERSRKLTTKRLRRINDAYADALQRAKNSSVTIDIMRGSENDKYAQTVAKLDDRRTSDARAELLDRMGKVMDECEQLENETAEALQRISSNIAKTPTEMLNEYALTFLKAVGLYDETDPNAFHIEQSTAQSPSRNTSRSVSASNAPSSTRSNITQSGK